MAAVLPQGARGAVGSGLACLTFRALWQVLLSWALPGRNEGWELMRRLEVKRVGQRLPFQQHTSHGTPCWRPGLQLTTCLVNPLAMVGTNQSRRACWWRPGPQPAGFP